MPTTAAAHDRARDRFATPTLLVVLDGFGLRAERDHNAVALARTPVLDTLRARYPHTRLAASGLAVGLPPGQMGNSEVGHTNLGAGRVVYQDIVRISRAIEDGRFFDNPALVEAADAAVARGRALHVLGLVSDGGVHSLLDHALAVVELAARRGVARILLHAFLDGRDTPPKSALGYLGQLEAAIASKGWPARIATVSGRYYAMDRDKRWERTERAYRAIVAAEGPRAPSAAAAVAAAYEQGVTDEFVVPTVLTGGGPAGDREATARGPALPAPVEDGDAVVFFNFRPDRARQLTRALVDPAFDGFARPRLPRLARFVSMTQYDATFERLGVRVAFPPEPIRDHLGELVSRLGRPQLRIAETEKYAHVTYFFSCGEEAPLPGEERCLVPSDRSVPTYDLKPEMSAYGITEEALARLAQRDYGLIVLNYANADMVGHTGRLEAAIAAIETIDRCLGRLVPAVLERGGRVLITADHGNAEQMLDETTGQPHTAHTTNPVPLVLVDEACRGARLEEGGLADVAPTLLDLVGVEPPAAMTGRSLLRR
ncbi:MAG TPA: 2,3-bisphosphoglycerate-independent phosphoglycerate mutase [Thermodesulfobacteriota bacterium]|nr:2,3-bisphosphoglycerate-independent phosphoglycerate mutase [Thermodesulfobacteriota bacterium]